MNRDPIRLRHDPDTGASLRDDLARAKRGTGVPYDEAQGLARLQAAIGGGGGPGGSSPSPKGVPPKALVGSIPWGSAAIGAGAAIALLAGWSLLAPAAPMAGPSDPANRRGDIESPALVAPAPYPTASSSSALLGRDEAPRARDSDVPARSRPAVAPEVARGQDSTGSAATAPPASALGDPAPGVSAASSTATLAEEVAQLARVRALAATDPAGALALVDEGHARFTGGALWLERESLGLDALVRLGRRGEASARGQRILQRYPEGPNAERIRRLLERPREAR